MSVLFSYLSAFFWGAVLGVICTIILAYLIKELVAAHPVVIGAIVSFMVFFLTFQFTALIAANKTKDHVANIAVLAQTVDGSMNWQTLENEYPMLDPYLKGIQEKVYDAGDSSKSIAEYINGFLNGYVWRRIGWIVGGMLCAFAVAVLTEQNGTRGKRSTSGVRRGAAPRRTRRNI